jgi:hypothetical protein
MSNMHRYDEESSDRMQLQLLLKWILFHYMSREDEGERERDREERWERGSFRKIGFLTEPFIFMFIYPSVA